MRNNKYLVFGIILILEVFLMWVWIQIEAPPPSGNILELVIVPFLLIVNLVFALVLWLMKKKDFSKLLIINGVFCAVSFHFLWDNWYVNQERIHYERWKFKWEDQSYTITIKKKSNQFILYEQYDTGSAIGMNSGEYFMKGDSMILTDNREGVKIQQRMVIHKDNLYGFNKTKDVIKLKK